MSGELTERESFLAVSLCFFVFIVIFLCQILKTIHHSYTSDLLTEMSQQVEMHKPLVTHHSSVQIITWLIFPFVIFITSNRKIPAG